MIASLRDVSPHLNRCELGYLARSHINFARACRQHERWAEVLRDLNLHVQFAPAQPEQPDGVFIQDIAVLRPEITLLGRPGAAYRLPEVETVGEILAQLLGWFAGALVAGIYNWGLNRERRDV